tara:strand:+ start:410 stop:1204 length:795 start_codon:yes stop_codon:yes gene_type:complete
MSRNKNPKVSIIIVNFNNAKYLLKSLESALSQTYKNKEIIVIDDISDDNSLEILNKYKTKIKFYVNKTKTSFGSYNQINSYLKGVDKSTGRYICFLDSDDYFTKNKVNLVVRKFSEQTKIKTLFDIPIIKTNENLIKQKFVQKKLYFSSWPRFTPQSCITIERGYANKIFKILKVKKFPSIWFDFRIAILNFLSFGEIFILNKHLTYYRQLENSASKNYKTFSINWWYRRKEAHEFFSYLSKKLKIRDRITLDKIITNIVNFFL